MNDGGNGYRDYFEHAPVSLWEQDLSLLKQYLDGLRASGVMDFRKYVLDNRQDMLRCARMVRVLDINRATVDLFGAANKEDLLQNLPKVLGDEARSTLWIEIMCLSSGKMRCGGNISARTLDGKPLHLRFTWLVPPGHEEDMSRVYVTLYERAPAEFPEHSMERLHEVMDAMTDGVILFGPEGDVRQHNPAAVEILGLGAAELERRSLTGGRWAVVDEQGQAVPPDAFPAARAMRERRIVSGEILGVARRGGKVSWMNVSGVPLLNADGELDGVVCTFSEITRVIELQKELRALSLHDDLTGLNNRRAFRLLGEQALRIIRRNTSGVMLLFLDVDRLKAINDTYGHPVGDQALRDVAEVLRDSFREADVIARYGGDEFVVLTADGASEDGGALIGRLQTNLAEYVRKEGRPYDLSVSVGVAVAGPGGRWGLDRLVAAADANMYSHKRAAGEAPSGS